MMTNQLKKVFSEVAKKKGKKRKHEDGSDDEDDNLATILATCIGMASTSSWSILATLLVLILRGCQFVLASLEVPLAS